jgi:hypothetical protein
MKRLVSILIAALLCAGAGCAGSGSNGPGVLPRAASPLLVTASREGSFSHLLLRVRVPKRVRERAHYVSPATASATIHVTPKAGCSTCSPARTVKVDLTASSPSCSASSTALTCTIVVAIAGGSYTGSLSTYDAFGGTLSTNQSFPILVVAGKANAIGVTLYGVPAGVSASLTDPQRGAQLFDATGAETIEIAGPGAKAQVLLTPVDSDDYIIAGPGAPKMSYALSGSAGFKGSATPGAPNVATIVTPAARTAGTAKLVVLLSGPGCSASNAVCAGSITIGVDPLVATAAANDTVEVETQQGGLISTIALPSGSAPTSIAFDSHGNLFVAGSNLPTNEFSWPYRTPAVKFGKPTLATSCPGMVLDKSDDVLVGQSDGVSMYAPPYTGTPKSQAFVDPQCLGMDGSGNLYITTAYGGGLVVSVPPPFFSGAYNAVAAGGAPIALAVDPVDDISLVSAAGSIWEYDKSLNLLKQGSCCVAPSSITYGNGYFVGGYNLGGGTADIQAYTVSGLGGAANTTFPGSVGSVAFDSQSNLLVATATGVSTYTISNPLQRNGVISTTSPAVAMATWP